MRASRTSPTCSGAVSDLMEQFREGHEKELAEYRKIKNSEKKG